MRVQNAYKYGITTLLNLFFLDKDLDYINKFTVKMVAPSTIEDMERDEQTSNRINQVGDIINLVQDVVTDEGRFEILTSLLSSYLNLSEIAAIMEKYSVIDENANTDYDDFDGHEYSGDTNINLGGFDSGPSDSGMDFDMGEPSGGGEDFGTPDVEISPEA